MANTTERRLELLPLDAIPEAPRNAKAHATEAIAASVGRFGYVEPMVIDERTGRLVAGHGRLADLRQRYAAGDEPPDGITRGDTGWLVPVVRGWRSSSDAEADAAAIALNRVGEAGGWQRDVLATILDELAKDDPELLLASGFNHDDLDHLLAQYAPVPSLDELERQYGAFQEQDDWATITIKAAQQVVATWTSWSKRYPSEGQALAALLDRQVISDDELVDPDAAPPPPDL